MINFPTELEYSDEDKVALRSSITNYLKGSDIHLLRKFGAECGIPASTSRGKDEVIDLVIKIVLREVQPVKRSGRGAPVKNRPGTNEKIKSIYEGLKVLLYGYFQKKNADEADKYTGNNMIFTMSQDHGDEDFTGFFAPEKSGGCIRKELFGPTDKNDIILEEQQVKLFPFRSGDIIRGESELSFGATRRIKKVISVNGKIVDKDYKSIRRYENLAARFPDKKMTLDPSITTFALINSLSPILCGQRVMIITPDGADIRNLAANLSQHTESCVSLIVGQGSDDEFFLSHRMRTPAVCPLSGNPEDNIARITLAVERVKRLAECGKDAVLIVDDLNALQFIYGMAYCASSPYGGATYAAMNEMLKIFDSARSFLSGGSVTVIAFARVGDNSMGVAMDQFMRIAECKLFLSGVLDLNDMPFVDFTRSSSRGSEAVLTDVEKTNLKNLKLQSLAARDFYPSGNETAEKIIKRLVK